MQSAVLEDPVSARTGERQVGPNGAWVSQLQIDVTFHFISLPVYEASCSKNSRAHILWLI